MKKTYISEDGTETVVEGTPEEIAAYERERSRSSGEKQPAPVKEDQGGRRVLTDELVRALEEAAAKMTPPKPANCCSPWCQICHPSLWPFARPWWEIPPQRYVWPDVWITCNGTTSAGPDIQLYGTTETIVDTGNYGVS